MNLSILEILLSFFSGFLLTAFFAFFVIFLAKKFNIIDSPRDRHKHKKPTPLLGGIAIGLSFILITLFFIVFTDRFPDEYINLKQFTGIIISTAILMIGGFLDDKYNLKPKYQILFPIIAIISIISFGIGIDYISNPLSGGIIGLGDIKIYIGTFLGSPAIITLYADIFTFFWLLGMSYTTKLLDGIDGLVSGMTGIGFLILGFLSLTSIVHQPDTAFLCFILAGCFLGFLVFNFPPAKIFLGESGSILSGFLLGTVAIVAGGKIATTLLILAIPVFDTLYVIVSRILEKKSPFSGDRRHLHYRLEKQGFSNKQILLFMYLFTLIIGLSSLVFDGKLKLIAFLGIFGISILLILIEKKRI